MLQELHQKGISVINMKEHLDSLTTLPIGIVNVMGDSGFFDWCRDHDDGNIDIWHDACARVQACKLAKWVQEQEKRLPSVEDVNRQRVLWQRRCDKLLDRLLCEYCQNEKDQAFQQGRGLDWRPTDCHECRFVRNIFDDYVSDKERCIPHYQDETSLTMWQWKSQYPFYQS